MIRGGGGGGQGEKKEKKNQNQCGEKEDRGRERRGLQLLGREQYIKEKKKRPGCRKERNPRREKLNGVSSKKRESGKSYRERSRLNRIWNP